MVWLLTEQAYIGTRKKERNSWKEHVITIIYGEFTHHCANPFDVVDLHKVLDQDVGRLTVDEILQG